MRFKQKQADQVLIKQIRDGDKEALILVSPPLRRFISSTLAKHGLYCKANTDDVFQQVFCEFLTKKNLFPNNDRALPLLCGFAKNLIYQLISNSQKQKYKDQVVHQYCLEQLGQHHDWDKNSETLVQSVKKIIGHLPKKKAQALDYYLFSGKSDEDIAKTLTYKDVKVFRVVISEAKKLLIKKIST
jgi:DNA-directed RNA polymerase specialized sigma24 family protein